METLYLQKQTDGAAMIDIVADWGVGLASRPDLSKLTARDLPSRQWPGMDGEDVYYPSRLRFKPSDAEFKIIVKGSPIETELSVRAIRRWLCGADDKCTSFMIYDPQNRTGRRNIHLDSLSESKDMTATDERAVELTVKIKISDPLTDVGVAGGKLYAVG